MSRSVNTILQNDKSLSSQNANWRSYFQELADFCIPRKANVTSMRYKGDRLDMNFLFDSTAILSVQTAVSGLQSHLTNQAAKWFDYQATNRNLMRVKANAMWFYEVTETVQDIMSRTNFYRITKEFYTDTIVFGTSPIFSEKDPLQFSRYRSIPIGEINLEEDFQGRVQALYWTFKLNPVQAYTVWGDKAGKTVCETWQSPDKCFDDLEFMLYVGPREQRDASKLGVMNMPYEAKWISKKDMHLIDESGFEEFPFHVGRWWKPNDDCFGFSPAMNALCEIKLRNAQKKTAMRRAMKETDPPLDVPSKGYVLPLNLNPAAMNYRDAKLNADNGVRAFGVGSGDFSITKEMMAEVKATIEQSFFVPLFQAFSQITKQMTVPEVQERIREGMVLLGPIVGDFFDDVFGPLLIRTFNIYQRQGLLPPAPESLQGQDFSVVSTSTLSRVQREAELGSIRGFYSDVGLIGTAKPAALDYLNEDKTVPIIAKIRQINPELVRSDAEVEQIRKQRAQIEQMAQGLDLAHKGAAIAKTTAEAGKAAMPQAA